MQLTDTKFRIHGLEVEEIANKYGTPLYIYDGDKILQQYQRLKETFEGINVKIKYAVKALTNQSILKLLKKAGSGIDVVSIQELHLGIKAGFVPGEIMFTPNCASFDEIREAVALGATVNIDSLPYLEQFGKEFGSSYPCCIRINPHINAGGNIKIMTGHVRSKFGISIEQTNEIYAIVKTYTIDIKGLHIHSGSDFKDASAFIKAADILFKIAQNFTDLSFIDLGSGFKVAYREGDYTTNMEELGKLMSDHFRKFCKTYGKEIELWFEPGKFLVSEAGHLIVKTNVVKPTPACVFIGVDSGLNHLIRPMMYGSFHAIENISNIEGPLKEYTVVGYICETDTFGTDLLINEVKEGDLLAIKNAGAYGFSMSSNYNSRFRPAEVLVYNNKAQLIRKRETLQDLLINQIEAEI